MEQVADRISEKMQTLTMAQLAEVERFVESLQPLHADRDTARTMMFASERAFQRVWNNPEDDAYDAL